MGGIRASLSSAENTSDHAQNSTSSSDVEKDPLPPNQLEPSRSGSLYYSSTISLPREILLVTVVCCAQLTTQVGLGQVLGILKIIADDFDIQSPGQESWLIAAYSLTVGSFILISGRLGDVFGYKKMLIIGYVWYSIWSLVCGLAVYRGSFMFTFASEYNPLPPFFWAGLSAISILTQSFIQGPSKASDLQFCCLMVLRYLVLPIRLGTARTWYSPCLVHVRLAVAYWAPLWQLPLPSSSGGRGRSSCPRSACWAWQRLPSLQYQQCHHTRTPRRSA